MLLHWLQKDGCGYPRNRQKGPVVRAVKRLCRPATTVFATPGAVAGYTQCDRQNDSDLTGIAVSTMAHDHSPISPVFRIDVSADTQSESMDRSDVIQIELLRQLVAGQQRQIELLAELAQATAGLHKQRAAEIQQWKDANPKLARACRNAAETLARVQTQFLESITEEVIENEEHLIDGEFMLHEFVDRFGPRMAHLNGVLQVLAQLGDHGTPAKG